MLTTNFFQNPFSCQHDLQKMGQSNNDPFHTTSTISEAEEAKLFDTLILFRNSSYGQRFSSIKAIKMWLQATEKEPPLDQTKRIARISQMQQLIKNSQKNGVTLRPCKKSLMSAVDYKAFINRNGLNGLPCYMQSDEFLNLKTIQKILQWSSKNLDKVDLIASLVDCKYPQKVSSNRYSDPFCLYLRRKKKNSYRTFDCYPTKSSIRDQSSDKKYLKDQINYLNTLSQKEKLKMLSILNKLLDKNLIQCDDSKFFKTLLNLAEFFVRNKI